MYIGKSPQTGAYSILDSLTASATASYVMQLNSVNYSPESAQHLIVSLNGSIQKPNSSFTCSGSTLTFSEALTSSDSIDFIYALGNVLDVGTVSDATITNAKTNFVSTSSASGLQIKGDGTTDGTLQLNCSQNSHGIKLKSPPHSASASYTLTFPNDDGTSGQALTTNGSGVLTWASAGFTAKNFFSAYNPSNNVANDTTTAIIFQSELYDTASVYNTSNGRFTVPSGEDGKYFIYGKLRHYNQTSMSRETIYIWKNGAEIRKFEQKGNNVHQSSQISTVVELAAGDYIQIYYFQNSGSANNLAQFSSSNDQEFTGYRIE